MGAHVDSTPLPSSSPAVLVSRSDGETHRIGEALGALCRARDIILLEGDLGAGKTALAQGIGHGLGVSAMINSPTFTLIKEYRGRLPFYHFDLYRVEDANETADLGIDEYLEDEGVCVVEWPERAEQIWPPEHLRIRLTVIGEHERRLDVTGHGARGRSLRTALLRAVANMPQPPADSEETP